MLTKFQFHITETDRKNRLDKFIGGQITAVSRMYLQHLIKEGRCTVNGKIEAGGYHPQANDLVEIEVDITPETAIIAEDIPLEILYEDSELAVVNKPPEMLVHPTRGVRSGTLLNALTYYFNAAGKSETPAEDFVRAGLVHRLDKKTSGLILISKTQKSHRVLSNHFQRKLVEKRYYAMVEGVVKEDCGTIDAPIGRNAEERFWAVSADGKVAESRFETIKRYADRTLLSLEPVTGRTNQLRLHCAHVGHPIIGDDKYGGREFPRLCLHAFRLSFWHPSGHQKLEFETELPKDFPVL